MPADAHRDVAARLNVALADHYRIGRELGAGGMATVYLAEDVRHHREVAIKVLHPETLGAGGADRFQREIAIAARLQHPHILPLHDSGMVPTSDGSGGRLFYYVMPYVEGETLREVLQRDGPLPLALAVRLLRDVADALAHAHEHGVVHRDIKPENVMIGDRHALVTDFGVAKALRATGYEENDPRNATLDSVTTVGFALGTPTYMSPEQATADRTIDHRSDIYALGVLAYELLTGRPPFVASSARGVLVAHLTLAPEPVATRRPEVSGALEALVMRCLAKDPADRWQSAGEIAVRLESIGTPREGWRSPRRRLVAALAMLIAAMVVAVAAVSIWRRAKTPVAAYRIGRVTALTTASGLELDPALSPDGRTLAYVAGPPGRARIYLRQVAGGGRDVPLTEADAAPNQRWPRWSPDGGRIAFQAGNRESQSREAYDTLGGTIYTVPALGGTPRPVVRTARQSQAISPAWSPDGRQLAFVRDDTLFVVSADGATVPAALAPAAFGFGPSWSPDGTRIAYSIGNVRFIFGTTRLANAAPAALRIVRVADRQATEVVSGASLR